jgi:hypothetical protein
MRQWHRMHLVRLTAGLLTLALHACSSEMARAVTLGWDATTEPGVAGYRVYYGVTSRIYTNVVDAGNKTSIQISGLSDTATYYFAVTAYNTLMLESDPSTEISFKPLPTNSPVSAPIAGTVGASGMTANAANVNGLVNPQGAATVSWFDWGPNTNCANRSAARNAGNGSNTVSVTDALASLLPGTVYYFRLVATNNGGKAVGSTLNLKTASALPTLAIQPASAVSWKGANLNGSVNPNGAATTAWFEYGVSSSYGMTTPQTSIAAGTSSSAVSAPLISLAPATLYHFRLVASNAVGSAASADATLVTSTRHIARK